jgi:DNA repair photolyase
MAPMIPGLNDVEIPAVLKAAADAGARFASYVMLRLPYAVAPLFETWLEQHMPERRDKILNRLRSMRDGDLYKSEFGTRMRGEGFHADQIANIFAVASRRYGLDRPEFELSTAAFRRIESGQLPLFD